MFRELEDQVYLFFTASVIKSKLKLKIIYW